MSMDTDQSSGHPVKRRVTVIGFGPRLAAAFIDAVLLGFFSIFLAAVIAVVAMLLEWYTPNTEILVDRMTVVCAIVIAVAYYVGAWTKSGQTVGKTLLGIKVASADGKPLSGGKALLRYVGYIVSAVALCLGFLWVAFDRKRQGWHDRIAGTVVVPVDVKFSAADAVEFVPSDPRPGWIWLGLWAVVAIIVPGGLLAGLWILGPFISIAMSSLLRNLR